MHTKPSPLATLKAISPTQADELYDYLRTAPYYRAVAWVLAEFGLTVSTSSLQRWWNRETKKRTRRNFRTAIEASKQFDKDLDSRALDNRAAMALRAAFWQAVTTNDLDSIKTLGTLILDYNTDDRDTTKLTRTLAAERESATLRDDLTAARAEIAELRTSLAAVGRANAADPAAVMAALDAALGLKPKQ